MGELLNTKPCEIHTAEPLRLVAQPGAAEELQVHGALRVLMGEALYLFANRRLLIRANGLYRDCTALRDARIRSLGMKIG